MTTLGVQLPLLLPSPPPANTHTYSPPPAPPPQVLRGGPVRGCAHLVPAPAQLGPPGIHPGQAVQLPSGCGRSAQGKQPTHMEGGVGRGGGPCLFPITVPSWILVDPITVPSWILMYSVP